MTSVGPHIKTIPSENAYFINVADMRNKVYNYNPASATPAFSTAQWASTSGLSGVSTLLATAGSAILKDLGKTVVSSLRTFRKVQLVVSSISSGVTIGAAVASQTGSGSVPATGEEYYTGYIELPGQAGAMSPASIAPVARVG